MVDKKPPSLKPEGAKVVVEEHLTSQFELRQEIHGEVYPLGGGRFYIIEQWPGADGGQAKPLDGERNPVRTKPLIKAQLKRAGLTMGQLALPKVLRGLAMHVMSYPGSPADISDQHKHDGKARVMPSALDITEFKECMTWLLWLEPDERSVVWLMGIRGLSCRPAAKRIYSSKTTVWRNYERGVTTILSKLLAGHTTS